LQTSGDPGTRIQRGGGIRPCEASATVRTTETVPRPARLGLGGPTLPQAEDCGRRLVELAPYRESGQRILMEALEQRGNFAEALRVYERLRVLLRDELGTTPGPEVQRVYRRLLDRGAPRASV